MKRVGTLFIVAMLVVLGGAACGGGDKVGEAFEDFEGEQGNGRIGEVEATEKPTAAPPAAKKAATPKPAAATPKPAEEKPVEAIEVKITSAGFDPTSARVTQGSTVKVTNTDSAAHTYTASDATYDTQQIAPGTSKSFQASKAGTFQMEDRTRNWIIGTLEVVPR